LRTGRTSFLVQHWNARKKSNRAIEVQFDDDCTCPDVSKVDGETLVILNQLPVQVCPRLSEVMSVKLCCYEVGRRVTDLSGIVEHHPEIYL
jgi:hypothetical protein